MKRVNLGLIGLGTVGEGVLKIFSEKKEKIKRDAEVEIIFELACDLDSKKEEIAKKYGVKNFTTDVDDVLNSPSIDIVVELIGGLNPAYDFIKKALENKKNVVTANKEVISQRGRELIELAFENGLDLMYEASVGGGIPIIRPLKEMLVGNEIRLMMGIVNGTTNYILTRMKKDNLDFKKALSIAKDRGYAEPDPSADINGDDAASKIAILSSIAFNSRVRKKDVFKQGISTVTIRDINYADELGYTIKLLAYSRRENGKIFSFVRPTCISSEHPLAAVGGVYNAIFVEGDASGKLMFYGEGAGSLAAGSSVAGDIVYIAKNVSTGATGKIKCGCFRNLNIGSIDEFESKYYMLLQAYDKPGVLAKIANCFGIADVSIASVVQKENKGDYAFIVFMTHQTKEANMKNAIEKISELGVVKKIENVFTVVDPE